MRPRTVVHGVEDHLGALVRKRLPTLVQAAEGVPDATLLPADASVQEELTLHRLPRAPNCRTSRRLFVVMWVLHVDEDGSVLTDLVGHEALAVSVERAAEARGRLLQRRTKRL